METDETLNRDGEALLTHQLHRLACTGDTSTTFTLDSQPYLSLAI